MATELDSVLCKIERDCQSLQRAIIVICTEFAVILLVGIFVTGVEIGKTLCR